MNTLNGALVPSHLALTLLLIAIISLVVLSWRILEKYLSTKIKQQEQPKASPIISQRPRIPVRGDSQILSIADSLITFSQFGANNQDVTHYDCLAKAMSCALLLYVMDSCLVPALQQTGKLTRELNDNLEQLAVLGLNAMTMFVFQNEEDLRHLTEALVNWQDDSSTATVVNLQEYQETHSTYSCTQINLTNLLRLIKITVKSNEKISKENDILISSLNGSMEAMGIRSERQKQQPEELQEALSQAHMLQSASEHWCRNLKIYVMNVNFTKLIDRCGGKKRCYVKDQVKHSLDKLLELKKKC
ncbi:hypothetical protein Pst134EB_026162 [Puccinia striiformis f. sp. tritici]|nr:hypothetical protein Pst134EB_026162 [Puccinia striiformis f. sp. tritici]